MMPQGGEGGLVYKDNELHCLSRSSLSSAVFCSKPKEDWTKNSRQKDNELAAPLDSWIFI